MVYMDDLEENPPFKEPPKSTPIKPKRNWCPRWPQRRFHEGSLGERWYLAPWWHDDDDDDDDDHYHHCYCHLSLWWEYVPNMHGATLKQFLFKRCGPWKHIKCLMIFATKYHPLEVLFSAPQHHSKLGASKVEQVPNEQWKKGPRLVGIYRRWHTTHLYIGIIINNDKDPY